MDIGNIIESILECMARKSMGDTHTIEPIFYIGYEETIKGLNYYRDELRFIKDTLVDEWKRSNSFIVLMHRDTDTICAVRDYGMYQPSAADFVFTKELIPIDITCIPESGGLDEHVDRVVVRYIQEVMSIWEDDTISKPLVLYNSLGSSRYLARSICECVDYEVIYRPIGVNFLLANRGSNVFETYTNNYSYKLFRISEELAMMLGLGISQGRAEACKYDVVC